MILALSLWSSLWGLAGAILAVPLTSMLVILFAEFDGTRPLAVLLAGAPPRQRETTPGSGV